MPIAYLPDRGVVEISGEDRVAYLQGLISNDVAALAPGQAAWAALLTPQGKWLADFFVLAQPDRFLLDCERAQAEMLVAKLSRFRLRSKVALRDASAEFAVHAGWSSPAPEHGIVFADPRLPDAGWRALLDKPMHGAMDASAYALHRLHGVSWTKGCYMGQELTARTRYRGLVKRRLVPVTVEGALPAPGTPVFRGEAEVGTMRSGLGSQGMALLRLEAITAGAPLRCGGASLTPRLPAWMHLPEKTA
ncbi:MAG: folate-binding protein YgfZ [Acetobacteraceae bacterium]|nr:folate-binding protein YgfZ [Acetobacteraceae bacterium]